MNSEKEKLKSALSQYQQAKQKEAERIEEGRREWQQTIEEMMVNLLLSTPYILMIALAGGINYYGWMFLLDFPIRVIVLGILFLIIIGIIGIPINNSANDYSIALIGLISFIIYLTCLAVSYMPFSDPYFKFLL